MKNARTLLKLSGVVVSGAVTFSLLRKTFNDSLVSGEYIPIPMTPNPPVPAPPAPAPPPLPAMPGLPPSPRESLVGDAATPANVAAAAPGSSSVQVTMPRGATPDPNKPTINLSVSLCDLEIGKAPGRALKIKKLKDADFATLPPASLDILPGQTLAITFQIRAGVPVDHVAVIVASTAQNGQDGDSRYRGACVAVVR